jgi:diaminopimelate epimerase
MLLENSEKAAFHMTYFNADGNESSMCGNGGRCIAHFAHSLGMFEKEAVFTAIDGLHDVIIDRDIVRLKMCDVPVVSQLDSDTFTLFTGSPHYVALVEDIPADVKSEGSKIRYSPSFEKEGINVNFTRFDKKTGSAFVATYERGVEDETLSCGTGVTAAALICSHVYHAASPVHIQTKGGRLEVFFNRTDNGYTNIWLCGPATFVFEGEIEIPGLI